MATDNRTENELRERPIGEVAKDLTKDLSLLVRQEIDLAKAEMAEKGRTAAPGLGMFGGAGIVGLCAAGAVTAFLVLVLSIFLPAQAVLDALERLGVSARSGLHTGECEVVGEKLAGIAVHTGARVAALAGPGEVLVSQTVRDLVAGSGIEFEDRGLHELKGLDEPRRLFAVRSPGSTAARP